MDKTYFFKELGFSEYEAKTLSSLTVLGIASPKEISLDSTVPQNKLYQILRNFEAQGILAVMPVKPKKYQLINLNELISKKIRQEEYKLKELKKEISKIEQIPPKEQQFIFTLIKGQKAIINKLAENTREIRKEILGVQRDWKYWAEGLREMEKIIKKGVKVKLIGVVNKGNIKKAQKWKQIGCEVKAYNKKFGENPLRFSIFDNKQARITIGKPEIQDSKEYLTIWTNSRPLTNTLRNQFLSMWKECRELK